MYFFFNKCTIFGLFWLLLNTIFSLRTCTDTTTCLYTLIRNISLLNRDIRNTVSRSKSLLVSIENTICDQYLFISHTGTPIYNPTKKQNEDPNCRIFWDLLMCLIDNVHWILIFFINLFSLFLNSKINILWSLWGSVLFVDLNVYVSP